MRNVLIVAGLSATLAGCVFVHAEDSSPPDTHGHEHERGPRARAEIQGRGGSNLSGEASFTQEQGGVLIEIRVRNAPGGWHAVHLHEQGDCSAPDASSAGGHFNPTGKNHGAPFAPEHHAGDLGNMWIEANGEGYHVLLMPELTVEDGPSSVRGRAIVVHEKDDDLVSQPTGNAGGRIGCGVIR
jgi:Cu-Zn family superoxide dismutase